MKKKKDSKEKKDSKAEEIKILLIDDEKDFTETLGFWLESQGFAVKRSSNGEEAVKIIHEDRPDMVFLDVVMPDMDGVEVLRRIRDFDKNIPVVMVTAYTTGKRIEEAERLGVSGFFRKSSDFGHVTRMIQAALTDLT